MPIQRVPKPANDFSKPSQQAHPIEFPPFATDLPNELPSVCTATQRVPMSKKRDPSPNKRVSKYPSRRACGTAASDQSTLQNYLGRHSCSHLHLVTPTPPHFALPAHTITRLTSASHSSPRSATVPAALVLELRLEAVVDREFVLVVPECEEMAPSSQPPILPVTQQGAAGSVQTSQATVWVLAGKAQDAFNLALSQKRPWAEIVDRSQLAKPESFSEAITRARKNWYYFRINYSLVLTGVVALSLIFNPGALFFLLALLAGWVYLYAVRSEPVVAFGRTFSEREVLAGMSLFTIAMIFMTSVGSILITALMIGGAICFAHGAYRVPDDLFLDEPETTGGFLSFLSSGTGPQVSHV